MNTLIQDLEKEIEGEVRFDSTSRTLYSTDASMYQIEPLGVVLPRHRQDVVTVCRLAGKHGVSVIPRGGGTGLAGQAIGRGIILDMSRYMAAVLELNVAERWVRVQPGVVLDELNACLKPHGLQFGPDVATGNRANIGGMVGNNSAGARSVLYGKTIDHVLELDVVLADATEATFRDLSGEALRARMDQQNLEGQAYRTVARLADKHREEIARRYPRILRRVGGYNLDEFVKDQPFNLCRMIVGSEGTLATVVEAKLRVVALPGARALGVVHYGHLSDALAAAPEILKIGPAGIEVIDRMILDQTKGSLSLSRQRDWVRGEPDALLVVELYGDTQEELRARLDGLEAMAVGNGAGYAFHRAMSAAEQANVWNVRKAGLGLLMGVKGDAKPVAFVEDTAVSPEKLPDYIREFDEIVRAHDTRASYYAHASVGLLHIRPLVNLKTASGVARMRSIAEQVRDLVLKYGGAMSGEHGDGLSRSCWNEQIFGSRLYQAFREVKQAFDPQGTMNPGKIVDAPPMTENLRYGPAYRSADVKTWFSFSADGGFGRAVEMCNGVGQCRSLEGTMCPTYMATLDEAHSTRGRANALRAGISGQWEGGIADERIYEVLDLCLECKACKSECPSNVDMAKLKYEFLAHYYRVHGRPMRAWVFANIETINRLGCAFAPFSNWIAGSGLGRVFMKHLGIAPERSLMPFARETFTDWAGRREGRKGDRKVVLFHDTYFTYNYPGIGMAAVGLLEAAGFEVILPEKRCCGRPLLSSGMIDEVKANIAFNVPSLYPYVEKGYAVVGCEPSCVSMLRDDYLDLTDDPRARAIAENTYMVEEYLALLHERGDLGIRFSDLKKEMLFHGHCHQKALWGAESTLAALNLPSGYTARMIDSGCCGMAGSFGYELEHYDVSLQIGDYRLLKAVRAASDSVDIVAPGTSCRQQIAHATGRKVRHPVEVLWEAVDGNGHEK